jgi:beta-lactam-binding protein with PASTA domain
MTYEQAQEYAQSLGWTVDQVYAWAAYVSTGGPM